MFLSHCPLDFVLNIFIYLHANLKKGHACGGQRTTCGFLLPLSGPQGRNLGSWAWQKVLLLDELSHKLFGVF